jgi:intracellular multiplication protein IcmO
MQREVRPLRYRIGDTFAFAGGPITAALAFMAIAVPIFGYGSMSDFLLFFALIFLLLARKYRRTYPLCRPADPDSPDPKTGKVGDGIILIGNDKVTGETVWVSNDFARTHMLVFGSTGSGKTRFLLSLFYQALLLGSGVMYVDGKGDTTVFGMIFSMVRRLGREDDLMIINYLTGSKSGDAEDDGTRLSNTNNPFAYGPAEQLRSLIVSLMRDGGGDDMWKGRASALLAATLQTLVYLRDTGEINMDVGKIRESLPLDRVLEFTQRDDLPDRAITLLKKYLLDLPGYNEEDAIQGQLSPKCYEQHGYLTMQLTEVLSELSSTYKHIFDAPLGEVDYKDLVYNRRILFVMLPALEKDPDSLAGLGKLVVAGVRSALAPALGEKVEGSHEEVMDAKPTNSNVPFLLIMDEYGYYSVKGFSVVAAQARSLGMSVIFAGQDFPSFKKGSEDEAKSVVANTNIKVCMKLEDQGETLQLFLERAGEGEIVKAAGHEMKGEIMSGYADNLQTRAERQKRINIRDLVSQKPGDAHILFGDLLFRCKLYFTNPNTSPEYRINKMLMVKAPSAEAVKKLHATRNAIGRIFEQGGSDTGRSKNLEVDSGLKALFNAYEISRSRNQEPVLCAQMAFGMMEHKERLLDEAFVKAIKGGNEPVKAPAEKPAAAPMARQETVAEPAQRRPEPAPMHREERRTPLESKAERMIEQPAREALAEDDELSDMIDSGLPFMRPAFEVTPSIKEEAKEIFKSLSSLITDGIQEQINNAPEVLSPMQQEQALPLHQMAAIEMENGMSAKEAFDEAKRGMDIIDERIHYPSDPQPSRLSPETLGKTLEMMLAQIEKTKNGEID